MWPTCLKVLSQRESNDCQRWIKHQGLWKLTFPFTITDTATCGTFGSDPTDLRAIILQAYYFGWPG